MWMGIERMDLDEMISELQRIKQDCDGARYSLETVRDIHRIAEQLKLFARNVYQSCY